MSLKTTGKNEEEQRNAKVKESEDMFGSPLKLLNYYFSDGEVG